MYHQLVFLTVRVHPFPFRTRQLSSPVPTILVWRRTGKIGQRQHKALENSRELFHGLFSAFRRLMPGVRVKFIYPLFSGRRRGDFNQPSVLVRERVVGPRPMELVLIAVRVHPFPFRTRQLSSPTPKILVWRRTGKIGQR